MITKGKEADWPAKLRIEAGRKRKRKLILLSGD